MMWHGVCRNRHLCMYEVCTSQAGWLEYKSSLNRCLKTGCVQLLFIIIIIIIIITVYSPKNIGGGRVGYIGVHFLQCVPPGDIIAKVFITQNISASYSRGAGPRVTYGCAWIVPPQSVATRTPHNLSTPAEPSGYSTRYCRQHPHPRLLTRWLHW